MAVTPWTRSTFTLFLLFWILQSIVVMSHISFYTRWIGFLGAKSNVEGIAYIYTTLLISTTFFASLLVTEVICQLRSPLTLERYHKLQLIKIRIAIIEMLALAFLCHRAHDQAGVVTKIFVLTACAGIPFNLSLGLAAFMKRRQRKKMEMWTKETDEETPLLS